MPAFEWNNTENQNCSHFHGVLSVVTMVVLHHHRCQSISDTTSKHKPGKYIFVLLLLVCCLRIHFYILLGAFRSMKPDQNIAYLKTQMLGPRWWYTSIAWLEQWLGSATSNRRQFPYAKSSWCLNVSIAMGHQPSLKPDNYHDGNFIMDPEVIIMTNTYEYKHIYIYTLYLMTTSERVRQWRHSRVLPWMTGNLRWPPRPKQNAWYYAPDSMYTVHALLCFVVSRFYPYPSGLLHWHRGLGLPLNSSLPGTKWPPFRRRDFQCISFSLNV